MVLAGVDDLLFRSRISAAAKALGIDLRFARSAEELVGEARASAPRLVIVDLNSRRLGPFDIVAALKADPALAGVPIVGFVSHVQADLVTRARDAGVDQVLARSAFVARLPELLDTPTRSERASGTPQQGA
jgi:CheY-like chemotaxis protein